MNFFENPFKKKPERKQVEYSKEEYGKAQQDVEVTGGMMKDALKPFSSFPIELRSHTLEKASSATMNLHELHEAAHTEAKELNDKYDDLVSEADEASRNVKNFKKEKLGGSE
ncbi:MAG: hypothetical protein NUV90_03160 [Candidatus Parcubacteria bacterium]|nr:hypothetical protein [Candidatus Parcubacteria bacterium]